MSLLLAFQEVATITDDERAAAYRASLLSRAAAEAERAALLTPISQAPALAVAEAWEPIRAWLIERKRR